MRNGISVGKWTECTQGLILEEKQRLFVTSSVAENRQSGDVSRMMATYASYSEAMECNYFGYCAALCGACALMQQFRKKKQKQKQKEQQEQEQDKQSNFLFLCIAGASTSGEEECLEECLQMWEHATKSDAHVDVSEKLELELEVKEMMIRYCIAIPGLKGIHAATFEWLSSRWSTNAILSFFHTFNN